ncbi:unnamed protein product [Rotaria sp. Silwood2]
MVTSLFCIGRNRRLSYYKSSELIDEVCKGSCLVLACEVKVSHLNAIDHEFKIKVQELRLYETVLTQRIHAIKSIANDTSIPDIKVYSSSFCF